MSCGPCGQADPVLVKCGEKVNKQLNSLGDMLLYDMYDMYDMYTFSGRQGQPGG